MLPFFCQRAAALVLPVNLRRNGASVIFPVTHLRFVQKFSSPPKILHPEVTIESKSRSITTEYLIKSCGLSPRDAATASERVDFDSPEKPDAVLTLLRNYGFSNTQISKFVKKAPFLLLANAERTLLPKFEFFCSAGFSMSDLTCSLSSNPQILHCSLKRRIIPNFLFLEGIVKDKVAFVLKHTAWFFCLNLQTSVAPNISVLIGLGVPLSSVSGLILRHPSVTGRCKKNFEKIVKKVVGLGIEPHKTVFINAVRTFVEMSESTLKRKLEIFGRWGLSEDEIWSAFRKNPLFMKLSDKKIADGFNYLVNKMGFLPMVIGRSPWILCYSLEARIIPRTAVIRVLLLRGLLKENFNVLGVLYPDEASFLDRYVYRYEEHVPQLFDIYTRKVSIAELGL